MNGQFIRPGARFNYIAGSNPWRSREADIARDLRYNTNDRAMGRVGAAPPQRSCPA
jgi:hypothetical protein